MTITSAFPVYKNFYTNKKHNNLFKNNVLVLKWAVSYPFLFDEMDLSIAMNQAEFGYHYYEWLAAILIYLSEGLHSLIEQYQFVSHKGKQKVLEQLTSSEVIEFMNKHPEFGEVQCPDLLVYERDYRDWFFVEVKGPEDTLTSE